MATILVLSIGGGLVGFVVFFEGLVWLIGRISGWARLATRFASDFAAEGQTFTHQPLHLRRRSRYGSVHMTVSRLGLHLAMPRGFRIGHAPLLLPWTALRWTSEDPRFAHVIVDDAAIELSIPRLVWDARPR